MSSLHITNGDCAADTIRLVVDGPVSIMADVLHEGPCPCVEGDAWHDVRARFLAGRGDSADTVKASLAAGDRTIAEACRRGDEIVLWFEHDLFDQLELIRTLDLLARLKPPFDIAHRGRGALERPDATDAPRVSLICIDRFPGVDRFIGLGQLTTVQIATLTSTAAPMTAGHFALARDTWRAFRSPDPSELLRIAHGLRASRLPAGGGGPALPFLADALLRFFAEYPSIDNGLSRTEALALRALAAGPVTGAALFAATQGQEERPFLGDLPFFDVLRRLASARVPLIRVEGDPEVDLASREVAITQTGRAVLAGRDDHVRLNGIDLWRGGVHLAGSAASPWRWDTHRETLVS